VLSNPNGRRLDRALGGLDALVSIDFYVNETTRHAHLILPAMAALEGDHYPMLEYAMGVRNFARYAKAALPPIDDARADFEILLDVSAALGRARGGAWKLAGPALRLLARGLGSGAILDGLLRIGPHRMRLRDLEVQVHGVDLGALQPRIRQCVATPDRKVNVAPEIFVADLARLERKLASDGVMARPSVGAEPAGPHRFTLVSRRTLRSMNSWLHNSHRLVRGPNRCTLLMHPDNAARLGVATGSSVRVRSRVGEIQVPVEVSDEVMSGVVSMPYGWGHDRSGARMSVARDHAGTSLNDLADERCFDAVSGTSVIDGIPVEISAC
jgi:anaerobic selenocysteine-containing dehydrogenase